MVADQEGDIYSHFARRPAGSDLLVRARHDRPLVEGGSLQDKASWPVATTGTVEVPARPGVPARIAKVRLQAGPVEVVRPSGPGAREPASLRLHGVCVQELEPPVGVTPLCWRLLTTRAVPDAAAAQDMVRLYRLRWRIEEVFRALKRDGLGLDETQVRVPDKLFRLSALALGAAVRILQLVDARDGSRRPMQDVLDKAALPVVAELGRACEGSTDRLRNPHPVGNLSWLEWIVARHGGWNAPNSPPGPKVVARGWERFSAMLAGALLARDSLPSRP